MFFAATEPAALGGHVERCEDCAHTGSPSRTILRVGKIADVAFWH